MSLYSIPLPPYHGSPEDRGACDAYYWRPADPHKYPDGTYNGPRVVLTDFSEICDYMSYYLSETDRKIWE